MEKHMKIDNQAFKRLRDGRGWSQEHLAQVSGLSLRTVQRVEAEGAGSAETKLALAAALNVETEVLTPTNFYIPAQDITTRRSAKYGYAGVALGGIGATVGILNGANTPFEQGVSFGILGLLCGLSCAVIGIFSRSIVQSQNADA